MKERRIHPEKLYDWTWEVWRVLWRFAAAILAISALAIPGFASAVADHEEYVNADTALAAQLQAQRAKDRMQLASNLLVMYNKAPGTFAVQTEEFLDKVKAVQVTGVPYNITEKAWPIGSYFDSYWKLALLGLWSLFGVVAIGVLNYRHHYLADLPWWRVWPVIGVALLGPIAWLCYAFSAYAMTHPRAKPAQQLSS